MTTCAMPGRSCGRQPRPGHGVCDTHAAELLTGAFGPATAPEIRRLSREGQTALPGLPRTIRHPGSTVRALRVEETPRSASALRSDRGAVLAPQPA